MAKGYWVGAYRAIKDPDALAAYAKVAAPALQAMGGRFVVRGLPAKTFEAGMMERLVIIEFDSVEQAIKAYESPDYQASLRILGDAVERDIRICSGM